MFVYDKTKQSKLFVIKFIIINYVNMEIGWSTIIYFVNMEIAWSNITYFVNVEIDWFFISIIL